MTDPFEHGPAPEKPDEDAPITDEDSRPIQPQDAPRHDDDQPEPSITGSIEEVVPPVKPIP